MKKIMMLSLIFAQAAVADIQAAGVINAEHGSQGVVTCEHIAPVNIERELNVLLRQQCASN